MTACKPQRNAYLFGTLLIPLLFFSGLAVVGGIIGVQIVDNWVALAAAGAWLAITTYSVISAVAQFKKARYEIFPDRIMVYRGGLLSDQELEVHYSKITHVKWVRPWLRHKFFGVGSLHVEVAGSSSGSIILRDLKASDAVLEEIRNHMHQPFSMSTNELLHEEAPSGFAILLDVPIKSGWALVVGSLSIGSEFLPLMDEISEAGLTQALSLAWLIEHAAWLLWAIPIAIIWAAFTILRCLDLKRRKYRVYDGVIEYEEGFLTRNDAFMPVENLSNSEITRGIVERIAKVSNVVISCQGTGQNVAFTYLQRGEELNAVLDRLIDQNQSATTPRPVVRTPHAPEVTDPLPCDENDQATPIEPPPLPREITAPELTYRMHRPRCLVPKLGYLFFIPLLIFAPPVLLVMVYRIGMDIIRMLRTTYKLRHGSVEERFEFIRAEQREFSREKITGVVFRESLLDRMFNTMTIQFWSIGSGKEITFRNVRKTDELVSSIQKRFGIATGEANDSITPAFGLIRFLSRNLVLLAFDAFLMLGTIVAAVFHEPILGLATIPLLAMPVIGYVWGRFFYRRYVLELHERGMKFRRGIITRTETWADYGNVKDVTTMKMPGFDAGAMRFNVAGERIFGNSNTPIPYGFTVNYVTDIEDKETHFDYEVLAKNTATPIQETETTEARKALKNTLVRTLLISILILPLIALLPIILPIVLWRAHLVRYRIESGRILMQTGRLFRQQRSILFDRIDHIQTSQGAINKFCGAGNVSISTAGSTNPELVLRDVIDHDTFYQTLRQHHRGETSDQEEKIQVEGETLA